MNAPEQIVAYVFVGDAHPADIDRIMSMPRSDPRRVHSAVRLIGTWDAFVALTVDNLDEIHDLVMLGVRGGESPITQTAVAVGTFAPPGLVTWAASPPVFAFSRIRVARGTASRVMQEIVRLPGVLGIAAVTGEFDIFAEFGGETFDEVSAVVRDKLPAIEGIRSCDTAFATGIVHNGGDAVQSA
jgi:DNA-binding Lrp family transcriptional regulator